MFNKKWDIPRGKVLGNLNTGCHITRVLGTDEDPVKAAFDAIANASTKPHSKET
jgi:hypothetical protein